MMFCIESVVVKVKQRLLEWLKKKSVFRLPFTTVLRDTEFRATSRMHITRKEVAGAEHCGRFIGRGGEASSVREDPVGRFQRGLGEIHGVEIGRFRESNKPSTVPRDVSPGPRTRCRWWRCGVEGTTN